MNHITDRGTQKRLYTKFHTMNNMRSGARVIKQSISRACRNHAFGIHESRQSLKWILRYSPSETKIQTSVCASCAESFEQPCQIWHPRF